MQEEMDGPIAVRIGEHRPLESGPKALLKMRARGRASSF